MDQQRSPSFQRRREREGDGKRDRERERERERRGEEEKREILWLSLGGAERELKQTNTALTVHKPKHKTRHFVLLCLGTKQQHKKRSSLPALLKCYTHTDTHTHTCFWFGVLQAQNLRIMSLNVHDLLHALKLVDPAKTKNTQTAF